MWDVLDVKNRVSDEFVVEVISRYTATFGDATAVRTIKTTFEGQPDEDFIPLNELTKTIVLGWVHEELGDSRTTIEAQAEALAEERNALLGTPQVVSVNLPN